MNKNPFVSQPSYTPQQPPLPPGPPPGAQPDYSAYWAAAAAQQQGHSSAPPTIGTAYTPQWPGAVPSSQPPRPPPEQSALYANYGYGNQWRQQQQHQQQQYQHPPVQPPPPHNQAAYNPYQPAVTPYTGQPYVGQPPAPPMQPSYQAPPQPYIPRVPFQQPGQMPPQQSQQPFPPSLPQQPHQQQHGPPAKRPRFDSNPQQQQQQQQRGGPLGPHQSFPGPSGQLQMRGGAPRGGGRGGQPNNRGGRGGSMGGSNRGGMASNRGGRGSFSAGGGGRGGNALRGQGSRGNFSGGNNTRRNGGSFGGGNASNASFNAGSNSRGGHHGRSQNRSRHDGNVVSRQGTMGSFSGKREENRRTLTDFKLIGLEIKELGWSWGTLPSSEENKVQPIIKEEEDLSTEPETQPDVMDESGSRDNSTATIPSTPQKAKPAASPPPSRLRIYFHTPVSADDARPIPHAQSSTLATPQGSRKGKRKKIADEDEDAAEDEEGMGRGRPRQREGSVAASVADTVITAASEADWLMAAIEEGAAEDNDEDYPTAHPEHQHPDENIAPIEHTNGHGDDLMPINGDVYAPPSAVGDVKTENEHPLSSSEEAAREEAIQEDVPGIFSTQIGVIPDVSSLPSKEGENKNSANGASPIAHTDNPVPSETMPDDSIITDVHESADTQVSAPLPMENVSAGDTGEQGQPASSATTQSCMQDDEAAIFLQEHDQEHLPEPPGSSASNTPNTHHSVPETVFNFTFGTEGQSAAGESSIEPPRITAPQTTTKLASANRLSISYAGGNKRLVIDAEVVEALKVYRKEGRVEVQLHIIQEGASSLKGVQIETLSETSRTYSALEAILSESDDILLPQFRLLSLPTSVNLFVYLDTERPLSEPKWVKSGDVQDWLRSMFGGRFWAAGDAADGWEKKIIVVDPDPPPTIWTLLEGWAANSPVGPPSDRQRFLKTHMTETDNILEILLRLVRGERATPFLVNASALSAPTVSGPLLSAISPSSAHAGQQTHVSLAVLAIFRMSVEYAMKADGDKGKAEVEERVSEIIRCLPSHLLYKSLDGIFKEWRVEKKGR